MHATIDTDSTGSQTMTALGRVIAERTETEETWWCARTGRALGSDTLDVLASARLLTLDLPPAPAPA